jgi:polar amino acid transport system substrate-binding protein
MAGFAAGAASREIDVRGILRAVTRASSRGLGAAAIGILILGLACGTSGDPPGATLAGIRERGEIRWGADRAGGEPFVYEDPSDPSKLIGFEVDIMDALARRLGVRPVFVQHAWSNLVPALERGDFDIAINGLEATAERRDRLLLSEPYYVYAETLVIKEGAPYRAIFDLHGKRVGTLNQTFAHDILKMMKGVEAVPYEGNEEPYIDLEHDRIDAVLLDNIIADRYGCVQERPSLRCVPYDVARGTYAIGMRKGDAELKTAIDDALAAMRADGELERILAKWKLWDHRQTETPGEGGPVQRREFDREVAASFGYAALVTLLISVLAFAIAVPVGFTLAVSRVYGGVIARALARGYTELFRGTPVLLQLYVLYYGLAEYIKLGPMEAAVIGLGLNYAAYEGEVYRGALLAIPRGQSEAARALGLGRWQTLRHVMLPQALRHALPAMTNDFVALLKDSAIVGVIAVVELTAQMRFSAVEMRGWLIPGIACAALYLALSFPLSELARRLERRLARDQRPHAL